MIYPYGPIHCHWCSLRLRAVAPAVAYVYELSYKLWSTFTSCRTSCGLRLQAVALAVAYVYKLSY